MRESIHTWFVRSIALRPTPRFSAWLIAASWKKCITALRVIESDLSMEPNRTAHFSDQISSISMASSC
jgi:hypothetical protein